MARFSGGSRVLAGAVLFALSALSPAAAEQELASRLVVALTEVERFEGQVAPVTVVCPSVGTCAGTVQVRMWGKPYWYSLIASVPGDRLSIAFFPRDPTAPRLSLGQGNWIDVTLQPDGTGLRDAAMTVLQGPTWDSPWEGGGVWPRRVRTPLANVRVTVRREDAAGQSR